MLYFLRIWRPGGGSNSQPVSHSADDGMGECTIAADRIGFHNRADNKNSNDEDVTDEGSYWAGTDIGQNLTLSAVHVAASSVQRLMMSVWYVVIVRETHPRRAGGSAMMWSFPEYCCSDID